jgi:hypothetical protein
MKFQKPSAFLLIAMAFFLFLPQVFSQRKKDSLPPPQIVRDSVPVAQHPPRKATIMSACLPGLGQAYNRKYWKIPVIYAGLGTFGYFAIYTNSQYKGFKDEYIFRTNNPTLVNNYPEYSTDQLKSNVDFYRRYRDLSVILIAAVYTLNIVDANVDAHLFTFDVSNDLSMRWSPTLQYNTLACRNTAGLSFTLKF